MTDMSLQIAADFHLGAICFTLGDYRQAEALSRRLLQSLADDVSPERFRLDDYLPAAGARCYLTLALAERGEFDEGITHAQAGSRLAEAADHLYSVILVCWALAYLYDLRGELSPAVRLLERALALSRESNIPVLAPRLTGFLGSVYARSQRTTEGLSLLHHALTTMEALGIGVYHSLLLVHLGEACRLAGRLEEAVAAASRALTLARYRGERGHEAWALRLLGEIASDRDPSDVATADGHYRQALALADELGMRPVLAHCHLGFGTLYRRTGKREEAHEHLTTATTMYREMGMTFWLEKANEELGGSS